MLDEFQQVLYVGKAKNLKNRVRQYFQNTATKTEKTQALVERIKDFRYILTKTEYEALVLENNLIKEYMPFFNILLKDDKAYPYLKINPKEEYPKVEITRKLKADGSKYFGPYMLGTSASAILNLIHSVYPIRSCLGEIKHKKGARECLNYHLGRCLAPCAGKTTREEYKKVVEKVIDFLSGDDKGIKKLLEERLKTAAEREEYEAAIQYRDALEILDKLGRKQAVELPKEFNIDVFAYATNGLYGVINYMVVRGGKVSGAENRPVNEAGRADEILSSYIMQFYDKSPIVASEILTSENLPFAEELSDYLSHKKGSRVRVFTPQAGVRGQLVETSRINASDSLNVAVSKIAAHEDLTKKAVAELKEELDLPSLPRRIECYDISNISGTDKVASMIVFINGEPARERYRRFKIKTVRGADDFASMREVISRRIKELASEDVSFSEKPDLLMVDGGKGQLSSAMEILGGSGISAIGLAKREEEIFLPKKQEPVILGRDSLSLKLLQRVRDEAHRFAITYHRKLRNERQTRSNLKNIEGIGEKRARALLVYFKKIENIGAASVEELEEVEGIGKQNAENIKKYFEEIRNN